MNYLSTRGNAPPHTFSQILDAGLAPDGGLFLPESLPNIGGHLGRWSGLAYAELAYEFLAHFATDLDGVTLRGLLAQSYAGSEHPEIAPLRPLGRKLYALELYHGPSLAFKDFGLQWLGRLCAHGIRVTGRPLNVLGATSGDTGAAAIQGFLGTPSTAIFILYPEGRIAPLQERQMACTGAPNVFAIAIDGTFDDAQAVLKEILGDRTFRERRRLCAVNSVNLARILAQCVYYLHAWLRLSEAERREAEFVVPTGNFGNVLAGWLLTKMGVPIRSFKVATNQNDILYRFFTTGEYTAGPVHPSLAPSMDIQAASNFERFLYYALGGDSKRLIKVMNDLKTGGTFRLGDGGGALFTASHCDDKQIPEIIRRIHRDHGYVIDPHTACGFADLSPDRVSIVLGTASAAKFPDTVRDAIGVTPTHPSLDELKDRPIVKHRLKADTSSIKAFIAAHAV
jgi:threonine synthase